MPTMYIQLQFCLALDILYFVDTAANTLETDFDSVAIIEPQWRVATCTYSLGTKRSLIQH